MMSRRGKEIVALIPARGGSKGIPDKNLILLAGKPLVAHTILDALESKLITRVYVSTDSVEIARISIKYGAEVVLRPKKISGDKASSEAALVHALAEIEKSGISPDLVVFLQCTSPIRTGKDIDMAINKFDEVSADSLFSGKLFRRFIWIKEGRQLRAFNYDYFKRPRRQDMLPQYLENGSFYILKPAVLKKYNNRLGGRISVFEMDYRSSFEIDTYEDFKICEWILETDFGEKR